MVRGVALVALGPGIKRVVAPIGLGVVQEQLHLCQALKKKSFDRISQE